MLSAAIRPLLLLQATRSLLIKNKQCVELLLTVTKFGTHKIWKLEINNNFNHNFRYQWPRISQNWLHLLQKHYGCRPVLSFLEKYSAKFEIFYDPMSRYKLLLPICQISDPYLFYYDAINFMWYWYDLLLWQILSDLPSKEMSMKLLHVKQKLFY